MATACPPPAAAGGSFSPSSRDRCLAAARHASLGPSCGRLSLPACGAARGREQCGWWVMASPPPPPRLHPAHATLGAGLKADQSSSSGAARPSCPRNGPHPATCCSTCGSLGLRRGNQITRGTFRYKGAMFSKALWRCAWCSGRSHDPDCLGRCRPCNLAPKSPTSAGAARFLVNYVNFATRCAVLAPYLALAQRQRLCCA